ncbi:MAG: TonB-dependent receptor, partial [Chitinophagales bacterium]
SKIGTSSNVYGFYSLILTSENHILMVSYVGYTSNEVQIELKGDLQKDVFLNGNTELQEVVVKASESEQIQELNQMSSNKLYASKIKDLPVLMGEADVIKSVQLLPGVQSVNENASGLYVRGGGPDQNLMLLDGVTIYDSNHLFGFVSIFDGDAINSVELLKGGFPAEYGGRLSSVLDVRLKEGNNQSRHAAGTVGLFSTKATLEGPIAKGKSSFHVSGRTSLTNNSLAKTLVDLGDDSHVDYGFYDIYTKANHQFSPNSRLFFSGYFGKDRFYTESSPYFNIEDSSGNHYEIQPFWKTNLEWNNEVLALRWNRILNPRLFANFSLHYSNYKYKFGNHYISNTLPYNGQQVNDITLKATSDIKDISFKADFDNYSTNEHHLKWGVAYTHHTFTPGIARFRDNQDIEVEFEFNNEVGLNDIPAYEYSAYIEDNVQIDEKMSFSLGVHIGGFASDNTNHLSPQPRLSMRYLLGEYTALKASFSRMTQFVHLVNTPWLGMPSDLWVPSSSNLQPKHSSQLAVGYVHRFPASFDLSIEGYYKKFENLLVFGHDPNLWMHHTLPKWEEQLERGQGWSQGLEILLERKIGRTTGWIAYTLSKSERQFAGINDGKRFPYAYDRRHDVSLALTQQLFPNLSLGGVWVFATGNVTTLPISHQNSEFVMNGSSKTIESSDAYDSSLDLNNYRLPSYHRLDISINWTHSLSNSERFKGTLKAGVYNLYNRENPIYINEYESIGNTSGASEESSIFGLYQVNLLPQLPFITYRLEF